MPVIVAKTKLHQGLTDGDFGWKSSEGPPDTWVQKLERSKNMIFVQNGPI